MKHLTLIVSVASLGLVASAFAGQAYTGPLTNDSLYAGINGGLEMPTDNNNYSADLGGQLGYRANNWRVEEADNYYFAYNRNALMTNGYYDFRNSSNFIPYAGLGLGWAHLMDSVNRLAFQGTLGVDYQLQPNLTLGVNYRYLNWGVNTAKYGPSATNSVNLVLNHYFS